MSPRKTSLARVIASLSIGAAAGVATIACGDDAGSRRAGFVSTGGDAGSHEASLPPSSISGDTNDAAKPIDLSDIPVVCATTPCATQLVAGEAHFCARMSDGLVRCWGDDTMGALGRGEPDGGSANARPALVVGLSGVVQLSAAAFVTCARLTDDGVRCWGDNRNGQLALDVVTDGERHSVPVPIALPTAIARVDVGQRSSCAVATTGALYCWGSNELQQLARPDAGPVGAPGVAELAGINVTRTSASASTTYAIDSEGALLAWGVAAGRESSTSPDAIPARLPTLDAVTAIAAGPAHACAIAGARVFCWGSSEAAALCTGFDDAELLPRLALIRGTAAPQQLVVSRNNTCARLTDGRVQCCGDDSHGQLGTGTVGSVRMTFGTATTLIAAAVQVVASATTVCALMKDGAVYCWGGNRHGELGQGTVDEAPHPTAIRVTF